MKIDKYLLFDGAIGTYYAEKNRPYTLSQANLLDYNTIVSIHREYIHSGANAITTNTFGISDIDSINRAIDAAYDATRDNNAVIFASIGPIADYEPDNYKPIIDAFINKDISHYIFETFPDSHVIPALSEYIKSNCNDCYIIASFAVDQSGYSSHGRFFLDIIAEVKNNANINAYGLNCVCGPVHMLELARKLDYSGTISIMPNSGYPSYNDGKPTYNDNPDYFAAKLTEIYNLGARIIGGCCGTTPKHIMKTRRLLDSNTTIAQSSINMAKPCDSNEKNNIFIEKMCNNSSKVIVVEYDPPLTVTGDEVSASARLMEDVGADAISIADNPLGKARADATLIASRVMRDTKALTVIPHITCRDRNAISIRSALIGLNIEDINNILCITGDPVPSSNMSSTKGVFSFNSYTLLSYVESINKEMTCGNFFLGAALNVNANNFHLELERAKKKLSSGAKYFITQPCYSDRSIDNLINASKELNVPIIGGIMPIKSYRNACFIKSEINGIDIPDDIVELYRDLSAEKCIDMSIKLSVDLAKRLKSYVRGYHIITPPKGEMVVVRLIQEIRQI